MTNDHDGISEYLVQLIKRLEQDNINDERQIFEDIAEIKKTYIEQNGQPRPQDSLNTTIPSFYRPDSNKSAR